MMEKNDITIDVKLNIDESSFDDVNAKINALLDEFERRLKEIRALSDEIATCISDMPLGFNVNGYEKTNAVSNIEI